MKKLVNWFSIEPHQLEWIVRNLYTKLGYQSIITSFSKDGGVDVFANYFDLKTETFLKVIVQIKRWEKRIGVKAVREILGVKEDQKSDKAIIVSVSGFTKPSKLFANRHDIQLIDGEYFEKLLRKVGLLKIDDNLVDMSDPNLVENRKKCIYKTLNSVRPEGLRSHEILELLLSPLYGITVNKEVLLTDIDDLSRTGEIIEEDEIYYFKITSFEASTIISSLQSDIIKTNHILIESDIYNLIKHKYNVPLVTAKRLIPVNHILNMLSREGKITRIHNGVYATPEIFTHLTRFDWDKNTLKENILNISEISEDMLTKTAEELRLIKKIEEGPFHDYYDKKPFGRMPFLIITLHYCSGFETGVFGGLLTLPLFSHPFSIMSEEEKKEIHIEIVDKHLEVHTGINNKGLKLIREQEKEIYEYGNKLIELIIKYKLEEKFQLASSGHVLAIYSFHFFNRKDQFGEHFEKLID